MCAYLPLWVRTTHWVRLCLCFAACMYVTCHCFFPFCRPGRHPTSFLFDSHSLLSSVCVRWVDLFFAAATPVPCPLSPLFLQHLLSEIVGAAPKEGVRCPNMESLYEYGSRAGFWRLHRLFTGKDLPLTGERSSLSTKSNQHYLLLPFAKHSIVVVGKVHVKGGLLKASCRADLLIFGRVGIARSWCGPARALSCLIFTACFLCNAPRHSHYAEFFARAGTDGERCMNEACRVSQPDFGHR